jgi:hypothetical protein
LAYRSSSATRDRSEKLEGLLGEQQLSSLFLSSFSASFLFPAVAKALPDRETLLDGRPSGCQPAVLANGRGKKRERERERERERARERDRERERERGVYYGK